MSFILSGLSAKFNIKEATYCAIVAAIVGHLAFFLYQESPKEKKTLEQAAQIYQQSTCDTSVKQAIERIFQLENIFEGPSTHDPNHHAFLNLFKHSHVNHPLLVKEAIQAALDNLISMKLTDGLLPQNVA